VPSPSRSHTDTLYPKHEIGRLEAIRRRELTDRSLTPGEASSVLAYIGELQVYGIKAAANLQRLEEALVAICRVEFSMTKSPYAEAVDIAEAALAAVRKDTP